MSDKKDPSGADLPPELNIADTEYFVESHKEEIVDFLEKKTVEDYTPTGEIYNRLRSQLFSEFPFGEPEDGPFGKPEDGGLYYDKVHVILANALTYSLWCGWLSKAMVNKNELNFKAEYLEQFKRVITKAFDIGRK